MVQKSVEDPGFLFRLPSGTHPWAGLTDEKEESKLLWYGTTVEWCGWIGVKSSEKNDCFMYNSKTKKFQEQGCSANHPIICQDRGMRLYAGCW